MSYKLPKRFAPILTGFFLSGFMTLIISGVAIWRNVGFETAFLQKWVAAYLNSWIISFPTVLVVAPFVRRLVLRFTRA
jgi:Protein of unknown function (DUF2798)